MTTKRIGEMLIESGLMNKEKLAHALKIQEKDGGFLGKILVGCGFVTEEQVANHLMEQGDHDRAYLPLEKYEIDVTLLDTFPEEVCRKMGLLPVDRIANVLTIAVADDIGVKTFEQVKSLASDCDIILFITTLSELDQAFDKYFKK